MCWQRCFVPDFSKRGLLLQARNTSGWKPGPAGLSILCNNLILVQQLLWSAVVQAAFAVILTVRKERSLKMWVCFRECKTRAWGRCLWVLGVEVSADRDQGASRCQVLSAASPELNARRGSKNSFLISLHFWAKWLVCLPAVAPRVAIAHSCCPWLSTGCYATQNSPSTKHSRNPPLPFLPHPLHPALWRGGVRLEWKGYLMKSLNWFNLCLMN